MDEWRSQSAWRNRIKIKRSYSRLNYLFSIWQLISIKIFFIQLKDKDPPAFFQTINNNNNNITKYVIYYTLVQITPKTVSWAYGLNSLKSLFLFFYLFKTWEGNFFSYDFLILCDCMPEFEYLLNYKTENRMWFILVLKKCALQCKVVFPCPLA